MNFIQDNLIVILTIIILLCAIAYVAFLIYTKQTEKMQKWLLLAVTTAEKELQSQTGRLKLEVVYDMFKERFPWLQLIMPRPTFERLVNLALEEMRHLLATNHAVAKIIEGDKQ